MRTVLIGATGNLGRPVARALAADDRFRVAALVRDLPKARSCLPPSVELIPGDLRDADSIAAALEGADAVYLNLDNPDSPKVAYDPDRDGTRAVLDIAKSAGVRRFARISALVAEVADDPWYVIQRKREVDQEIIESGLEWNVFRPTWFTESIPMFLMGSFLLEPLTRDVPLRWIAGADYARVVAESLADPSLSAHTIKVQGPEAVTFRQAFRRFQAAYPRRTWRVPVPMAAIGIAGHLSPQAKYFKDLLAATFRLGDDFASDDAWRLATPTLTIEDYARSIADTGDRPSKM